MSKERDSISHELAEVASKFAQQDNLSSGESQSVATEHNFSIKKPFISDLTIKELLNEGYIGVDYELGEDTTFAAAAYKFQNEIKWTKTQPDENGDIALMTLDLAEFDQLLEFMLDNFGWCPQVHSNQEAAKVFIFTPQNDLEKGAIALTTEGDSGWKGSLYSLDYFDTAKNKKAVCLIFATKPKNTQEQEWLLVQIDLKKKCLSWSIQPKTLEQVYYLWAEKIGIKEPNFKPTADEILDSLEKK